ncbi:G patch domain-containing protein 1 [Rhynchospora pubera]|uniref:G patch domain-containing protein 1 n=1 Tax=Rhynchospora pubera TaxID=906938 RepID=A0AAV8GWP8_9POAL|nr:G patch domain-containing protein 1 [Rhynchospora pubera]
MHQFGPDPWICGLVRIQPQKIRNPFRVTKLYPKPVSSKRTNGQLTKQRSFLFFFPVVSSLPSSISPIFALVASAPICTVSSPLSMADVDEEDYVYFGTPIEREEEISSRKRKAIAEPGTLRSLPPWKQEVTDEEGRRRFHGAFTGGYSAGYYNTVGSKEGWTPQTFTSSRKNRAEVKKQNIYSFLDEDDLKDIGGNTLETSMQYDTFGFTAAEFARKKAEEEQKKRPSAIPGPAPDEIVLPASSSIGMRLLMKMGWRQGHSIKDSNAESLSEIRREARKAFMALSSNKAEPDISEKDADGTDEFPDMSIDVLRNSENTPVYVLNPKQDMYGLGYDPFKHAPEFRDSKRLRESKSRETKRSKVHMGSLLSSNSKKYAPGFGIGALEELDAEDEDIYASGFDYEQTEVELEPSKAVSSSSGDRMLQLEHKKRGSLLGFKLASDSDYKLERFYPPAIPSNFRPIHKFGAPLDQTLKNYNSVPPPDAPPPENTNLRLLIEGSAAMVARCGKSIEDLYMEKSKTNPLFLFLKSGAEGYDYYVRKLWENKQKFVDNLKPAEKLTAENRGRILGERPLASTTSRVNDVSVKAREVINTQSSHGDTVTKPISLADLPDSAIKQFKHDPAKQERFELFLKEKYQGGLRASGTRSSTSTSTMSEADRARERLDFEAAAEAIEKGKQTIQISAPSTDHTKDLLGFGEDRFVSSTLIENSETKLEETNVVYPKREQFEWRPSPILCKRFDLIDPYMGKPPPVPRPRSKMDSLIFLPEIFKSSNKEDAKSPIGNSLEASKSGLKEAEAEPSASEADVAPTSPKNVERPVDLYKAIFSDDSDDDEADAGPALNQALNPVKSSEGANKTLNRLVAGDFLESLGKELGLEVPPGSIPGPSLNANTVSLPEEQKSCKGGDDRDNTPFPKVKETKSKDYGSTVDSSREKKRSHSKHHRRRSRTPDLDPDSGSDSDSHRRHRSRSKKRHDRRDRSRSRDSESSDEAYMNRKERRKKHHSRHHEHKKKDYGDKYSDKKRRS